MTDAEIFDFFNEQMRKIGTATRSEVHEKSLWHQTFHCWMVNTQHNGNPQLLFQLRHREKETFPNLLDTSSAGHLVAGETAEDGIRELQEELGVAIPFEHLHECGTLAEEHHLSGDRFDREFQHLYWAACDWPLERFRFQTSEVSGLFYISLDAYELLLNERLDKVEAEGIIWDEADGKMKKVERVFTKSDFVSKSDRYCELLFRKIKENLGS